MAKVIEVSYKHRFDTGLELDVSFSTNHRVTTLFGPSGSGKTTTLLAIAGFIRPMEGRIIIRGHCVLDTARKIYLKPEKRRLGVVFQRQWLFPHLSVASNLRYGMKGKNRPENKQLFHSVVETLELEPLLDRRPWQLSGGEAQRVAIGRALLTRPDLLIMDEPVSALDVPLRMKVLDYIERVIRNWDIPMLLVTHEQAVVRRLSDWVVLMEKGRTIGSGPAEEILADTRALSWGNAAGPVNLLHVERFQLAKDVVIAEVCGQKLVVAMRPGHQLPHHNGPAFVQFSPNDVILAPRDIHDLSARNHLLGTVHKIVPLQNSVMVAVDVGEIIWAEITHGALERLQITPGRRVACLIKAHRMQLLT